jgi:hypothetical protein
VLVERELLFEVLLLRLVADQGAGEDEQLLVAARAVLLFVRVG